MSKINTICIIDDDPIYTFLLNRTITKLNICDEVLSYVNGEVAINAFYSILASGGTLPDIILLDINMPLMDGWQFIWEFKKILPKVEKKIALYIASSSITIEDRAKARAFPEITEYLVKPIEPQTLLHIAERFSG